MGINYQIKLYFFLKRLVFLLTNSVVSHASGSLLFAKLCIKKLLVYLFCYLILFSMINTIAA